MGLGLDQGLLEQLPITNGARTAAKAAPLGSEGLNAPAELIGRASDGLISRPFVVQQGDDTWNSYRLIVRASGERSRAVVLRMTACRTTAGWLWQMLTSHSPGLRPPPGTLALRRGLLAYHCVRFTP